MLVWLVLAAIIPPEPLTQPPASYPASAVSERTQATVVVRVTVGTSGTVSDPEIVQSGGEAFDTAALDAVRMWTFKPAMKDGAPVAAKIRVPFDFRLPPASQPAAQPTSLPSVPASLAANEEPVLSVNVRGKRDHSSVRGASDIVLSRQLLIAAPHADAGSMLRSAPGVYVSRPEGDAVAHQIFLRGFDAEHGQDIELSAGGVSLNRVSHIHGQGYADLNLLMPEVVRSIRVTEGVYDPRQGDFAVAGSIAFDLGVVERGLQATSRYGSFNAFRQTLVFAPRGEAEETFGAAFFSRTDGFGTNRGGLSGGAMGQYAFKLPAGFSGLAHVAAYGARAGLAGVVRTDDVRAGLVDFYGAYSDPSAQAQSALSTRAQALLKLERLSDSGHKTELTISFATTDFTLRSNFTGYAQRSIQRPQWTGRGDLFEQRNTDYTLAGTLTHRFAAFQPSKYFGGVVEAGVQWRHDFVSQKQSLLQQPRNETWDQRIDAAINGTDIGFYLDAQLKFLPWLALRGGLRGDVLVYNVDDKLANVTTSFRSEQFFAGYRRTALGAAFGPRVSVDITPLPWLKIVAAYGEGYRSPQARQLEEGETAPFAKVRGTELGIELTPHDAISVVAAGYATFLSNDLAFDATEGRLERIGPTSRKGAVVRATVRPLRWLFASASFTYVNATLDAPPAPTPENPTPPYVRGQLLPYVPPVVVRVDASATGTLAHFGDGELIGKVGAGFSLLSARPLPYGQYSAAFATLDAQASLSWRWFTLGVEANNITNTRYAANEYVFVSQWPTREIPSRLPARHTSAAAPFSINGVLGVGF
jgi:iron complex outermembrane receptor protein